MFAAGGRPGFQLLGMEQQQAAAPRKERKDKGAKHKQPHKKLVADAKAHMEANDILFHMAKTVRVRRPTGWGFFSTSQKGAPDCLIFEAGKEGKHGLAVEFKCGFDELKPEQEEWAERLKARGWR